MKIKAYKIADTVFAINSLHDKVHELCKDYLSEEPIEFTIKTKTVDIKYERKRSEQTDLKEGILICYFSDEYLETLPVYRCLCEKLLEKESSCSTVR